MAGADRGVQGGGSLPSLRQRNERHVLDCLDSGRTLSQAQLARATGLAPSTVSNLVSRLVADKVLATAPLDGRSIGVRLARGTDASVGVDVGHRHITVVVATRAGTILAEGRRDTGSTASAGVAADPAAVLVKQVLDRAGLNPHENMPVGLGVPTPIDRVNRQVAAPSILPGWVGVDLGSLLTDRLGVPVWIDNDANLGALAEHQGGRAGGTTRCRGVRSSGCCSARCSPTASGVLRCRSRRPGGG